MKHSSQAFDAVVIGAGAAGLATAAALTAEGRSVCVLEARERIGGRILTLNDAGLPVPIELGAEFIHGRSPATFQQLQRSGQIAIDAPQTRWVARDGHLQPADALFDRMKQRLQAIARPSRDLPFAEFLERHRRALSGPVRSLARTLVEGFDAADASRVSTTETLKEWSGASAADAPSFRPSNGYGRMLQGIARTFRPDLVDLKLSAIAREVRWRPGHATVGATQHGEALRIGAPHVVVTVPLGVLQLPLQAISAIRFDPGLDQKHSALSRLSAGPVVKLVMHFARAFWEEIDGARYRNAAFFHCPDAAFPTCWTALPWRARTLTLWAAGPNATRLVGSRVGAIVKLALESLTAMFGRRLNYRSMLESVHCHDWQQDPYSLGAYSYPLVNGAAARRALARPLDRTLFFAGEATDSEESASVGGALSSGKRAASEILRAAPRTRSRKRRTVA